MMIKGSIRCFSSSSRALRAGYSTVEPVHHLVKIRKAALKPGYKDLLIPKNDIRAVGFKPEEICQDRVHEHYVNTIQSDMLLHFYEHDAKVIEGNKKRSWGTDSPYALYRNLKKPKGLSKPTKDIHPVTYKNIPELKSIVINAYNSDALDESWLNISTKLQLSQITNVKPKQLYNKSNVLPWKVREGKPCGAKVELTGRDMNQFLSTLTELVLPRIRTFKGIKNTSGDSNGNISFGLTSEDVKYFPEIENFQELFPNLFGFHITFKTSARTDEQARTLLSSYGFPFYNPA
ncbi:Piso0_003309 [Millerozyma farinosa CBS 7064]|uniref:Large ribosomal subunit protein uL5m n=1 Tax=Pichia sorbitophila (strain ATCC MYA-4447 / BCRC 22081 / CBS 7064 / NBRC 10061 / NRRL Y-12695) TaxID=559304 RepID=G8YIR2_PICSO|nr:Piso0_003309 [Millerozyma farinosa CBS 7064]CCE80972.1 Piso0_003309 [Millerozyma farinosa CBS 7064]